MAGAMDAELFARRVEILQRNMRKLKPLELAFWREYLDHLAAHRMPRKPFVEAAFAGGREATDGLIRLYRQGKKTAGSSLVEDFKSAGDPLPKVGNYWIILDSKERPQFLVRTVRIEINRFGGIPASVARAEGEGDLSAAYWKAVHRKAFLPSLAKWGIDDLDRAEVITEHFEILHGRATSRRAR
jgi:uncharacterized protein YhfF